MAWLPLSQVGLGHLLNAAWAWRPGDHIRNQIRFLLKLISGAAHLELSLDYQFLYTPIANWSCKCIARSLLFAEGNAIRSSTKASLEDSLSC
jgi:hypothetical protein